MKIILIALSLASFAWALNKTLEEMHKATALVQAVADGQYQAIDPR